MKIVVVAVSALVVGIALGIVFSAATIRTSAPTGEGAAGGL